MHIIKTLWLYTNSLVLGRAMVPNIPKDFIAPVIQLNESYNEIKNKVRQPYDKFPLPQSGQLKEFHFLFLADLACQIRPIAITV